MHNLRKIAFKRVPCIRRIYGPAPLRASTVQVAVRHLASSSHKSTTDPQQVATENPPEGAAQESDTTAEKATSGSKHHKTMAEMDEELRQKMAGIDGDGGAAGVEYEDGKPVAMKRSVKNNMFRYI